MGYEIVPRKPTDAYKKLEVTNIKGTCEILEVIYSNSIDFVCIF